MTLSDYFPWLDRAGRLSGLRLAVFVLTLVPAVWIAAQWSAGALDPKPVKEALHSTGTYTLVFLLLSLSVTPLRRIFNWAKLIQVRRMLGLAALGYLVIHFALYTLDQKFILSTIASEIVLRIYLTIGFVAFLGMIALGVTSNDASIRRLGAENWNRLHKITYALTALGLLHHFMQSKIDVTEATWMSGYFALLMFWRFMQARGIPSNALTLSLLAVAAGLATVIIEASWYGLATGVPASRVLWANLDFEYVIKPAWWILASGLALAAVAATVKAYRALPGKASGTFQPGQARQPSQAG